MFLGFLVHALHALSTFSNRFSWRLAFFDEPMKSDGRWKGRDIISGQVCRKGVLLLKTNILHLAPLSSSIPALHLTNSMSQEIGCDCWLNGEKEGSTAHAMPSFLALRSIQSARW